jgi:predicted membrane-bound mannosyltransferase
MAAEASYTRSTGGTDGKGRFSEWRERRISRREDSLRDRKNTPRTQREQQEDLPAGVAFSAAGSGVVGATTLPRPGTRRRPGVEQQRPPDGRETYGTSELELETKPGLRILRSPGWTPRLSVESGIYVVFLFLAFLTRFWDLGTRALHHDESLHAYYSWVYETGGGYRHHPLMHGPFLFHIEALFFFLFGDSDATSRYAPAIFGVILIGLPYFLRGTRFLGRWGALSASFFLLISPSIFYMSRYIRHDIFTIVGTMVLFICIVRYIEKPERRWLIGGAATTALLLTNHEIIFAILVAFFIFLYGALIWSRANYWRTTRPEAAKAVVGVHIAGFVGLAVVYVLTPQKYHTKFLDIPWDNPTRQEQLDYYVNNVFKNPLIIGLALVFIGFLVALRFALQAAADPEDVDEEGLVAATLEGAEEHSVENAVRTAWTDRYGLFTAIIVAAILFCALFTSLFTNLHGLASSTFATNGTLLYWLGQHDVRRGDQPWFYFLLLFPQYEFIAATLGLLAIIATLWRSLGSLTGRWSGGRNLFFRLFLVTWFVIVFAGLSMAGEKMPWLVTHIALPGILLAAVFVGGMIDRATEVARVRREQGLSDSIFGGADWAIVGSLLALAIGWFFLAGRLTEGEFVKNSVNQWERSLTKYDVDHWWWLAIAPVLAILVAGAAFIWRGPRRAGQAVLVSLVILLALLQVHTEWRLTYLEGDIPKDMLVYTQTSPDMTMMMSDIDRLSAELTGGKDLEVWYDSGVSWPMQWYLRDYPNKRFFGSTLTAPPGDAPIVLVANDNLANVEDQLKDYTPQQYVLRWWYPEDQTYRDFAIAPELEPGRSAWKDPEAAHGPIQVIGSIVDAVGTLFTPEGEQKAYRLVMYRDLPASIGQYRYTMFVRNDLLPYFNGTRY